MKATLLKRGPNTTDDDVEMTLAFGDAIMVGIEDICRERHEAGKIIDMKALLGALTSALAHYIAGIPDEEQRMACFGMIGQQLADMIIENVMQGTGAQTYSEGDFRQ